MSDTTKSIPIVGVDVPWDIIDKNILLVSHCSLFGRVDGSKVSRPPSSVLPYAILTVKRHEQPRKVNVYITNKDDFRRLWEAYHVVNDSSKYEINIIWHKNPPYKFALYKLLKPTLPRITIWISNRGAFRLIHEIDKHKPGIGAEAEYRAEAPLVELKPKIFE